jgi:hypothetical protein
MRNALSENYDKSYRNAVDRGVEQEFERLLALLRQTIASANLELRVASNVVSGQAYRSYYDAVDDDRRQIAKRDFHANRAKVDSTIHTGYATRIVNMALSPDGRGLPNYGQVSLLLRDDSVSDRCSLLRENAFKFFTRFALGDIDKREEPGWRSVWEDRALLGAAALEPDLRPGMSDEDLRDLILRAGGSRLEDRYIEVHLYDALMREYVRAFYLASELRTASEEIYWEQIKEKFAQRGVELIESPNV